MKKIISYSALVILSIIITVSIVLILTIVDYSDFMNSINVFLLYLFTGASGMLILFLLKRKGFYD